MTKPASDRDHYTGSLTRFHPGTTAAVVDSCSISPETPIIVIIRAMLKQVAKSNVSAWTPSEIIGFLKGKCAIKIFERQLEFKKRYWGRHFWAKGYCVSTVGLDEEKIWKYVKWQLEKDKRMEQLKIWQQFLPYFRGLLNYT